MSKKKIFIVEDETLLLDFITDYIMANPLFKIVGACTDGFEALSQCAEIKPDLVILDLHLPGLNGVEVLKSLRRRNPKIKFLVFSSACNARLLHQVKEAGANGFIDKVSGLKEFSVALETILKGGQYFSESVKAATTSSNGGNGNGNGGLSAADLEILDRITQRSS